jgi:NAD-dependent deacetylase
MPLNEAEIAKLLRGRVLVLTGAGVSAASGIQTFRGHGGLYEGLNPYELASPEAFFNEPAKVWRWYLMRIRQSLDARPNPAHTALADLEQAAESVTIVTSNVDNLHQQAGSKNVFRLHGDVLEISCTTCGKVSPLEVDKYPERVDDDTLPACECGGIGRPNVVWFGEYPWPEAIDAVERELPTASIVLEVGSSGVVSYGFSDFAAAIGKPVVRINPEGGGSPGVDLIQEPAEVALPRLVALAKDCA